MLHTRSAFARRSSAIAMATMLLVAAPAIAQDLSLIHISEPTRLGMISYAVFCLKKKNTHLRAHETRGNLVCRLLLEKKKKKKKKYMLCAV